MVMTDSLAFGHDVASLLQDGGFDLSLAAGRTSTSVTDDGSE